MLFAWGQMIYSTLVVLFAGEQMIYSTLVVLFAGSAGVSPACSDGGRQRNQQGETPALPAKSTPS